MFCPPPVRSSQSPRQPSSAPPPTSNVSPRVRSRSRAPSYAQQTSSLEPATEPFECDNDIRRSLRSAGGENSSVSYASTCATPKGANGGPAAFTGFHMTATHHAFASDNLPNLSFDHMVVCTPPSKAQIDHSDRSTTPSTTLRSPALRPATPGAAHLLSLSSQNARSTSIRSASIGGRQSRTVEIVPNPSDGLLVQNNSFDYSLPPSLTDFTAVTNVISSDGACKSDGTANHSFDFGPDEVAYARKPPDFDVVPPLTSSLLNTGTQPVALRVDSPDAMAPLAKKSDSFSLVVSPTAGGTGTHRERVLQMHRRRAEDLRDKQRAKEEKHRQASERRQFIQDHPQLRRFASWRVMLTVLRMTHPFLEKAAELRYLRTKMIRVAGKYIHPRILVVCRRLLRRIRIRAATDGQGHRQPNADTLMQDKVLRMFPEAVVSRAAMSMTLQYYFPNEAIVFMGCEDDEGYVLASGTADVMMGRTKVFTMQPGMVFGTIGMISGEPRSASIMARGDGCLAWVMKRAAFDAAGDAATVAAAHAALDEVRQKNMLNVYKSRLEPSALSAFHLFSGLTASSLRDLLVEAVPRVVRRGTSLSEPDTPSPPFLLLKGRVMIRTTMGGAMQRRGTRLGLEERSPEDNFTPASELRNFVDLISGVSHPAVALLGNGDPATLLMRNNNTSHRGQPQPPYSCAHEFVISAPALLNAAPLFLPGPLRSAPYQVSTDTDCDLLVLSRKTLRSTGIEVRSMLERNALNAHALMLGVPTKREVVGMLLDILAPKFRATSMLSAVFTTLRNSVARGAGDCLDFDVTVLPAKKEINFNRENGFELFLVLDGELEGVHPRTGFTTVWPDMAKVFFASTEAVTRVARRALTIRLLRHDVILWLHRAVPDALDFRCVCTIFAQDILRQGGAPSELKFNTFGFASEDNQRSLDDNFSDDSLDDMDLDAEDVLPRTRSQPSLIEVLQGQVVQVVSHLQQLQPSTVTTNALLDDRTSRSHLRRPSTARNNNESLSLSRSGSMSISGSIRSTPRNRR